MLESSSHFGAISIQVQLPRASALMPRLFVEGRSEGQLDFLACRRGRLLLTSQKASWQDIHEQNLIGEIQGEVVNVGEQTRFGGVSDEPRTSCYHAAAKP